MVFFDIWLSEVRFLFKRNSFWDRAKKGDSVLDLCCGSGDLAFLLSEKVGSSGKVCSLLFVIQLMLPKFGLLKFWCFSMNLNWFLRLRL